MHTTSTPHDHADSATLDDRLRELANAPVLTVFQRLASSPKGLTEADAADRLRHHGDNRPPAVETTVASRLGVAVRSPFVALLAALGVVFVVLGDARGAVTVAVMVALSIALRFWQHTRSDRAVRALRTQVSTTVTVRRRAEDGQPAMDREVPVEDLVPGDVVVLTAGDVVPADVRIVAATDLAVDQSALSGETLPVAKQPPTSVPPAGRRRRRAAGPSLVESPSLGFAGTAVVAGRGTAVVLATGANTHVGALAKASTGGRPESSFDHGVRSVGWTLIRFMLVMVPIVVVVNGTVTGDWAQATMFATAVAVGLTPEMLPVIVTTNLARGAHQLARRQVIVTRLNAIQDLGAMDVLCVDKTGTLTEDRIVYAHSVDALGQIDGEAADHAYLAVHHQDSPPNRLDEAIADQLADDGAALLADALFTKVDEIGFDHTRRRATVVVRRHPGEHILITKGDPDEILPRCAYARRNGEVVELDRATRRDAADLVRAHADHGMRVLAVATRTGPARPDRYGEKDEANLVLVGFVGFVDPVRASAAEAVRTLTGHGVAVKILTGDNQHVAAQVAEQAGVDVGEVVLGGQLDTLDDTALGALVERTTVFARLTPAHKARVVAALRGRGHAVGFLGDGVNDVPVLRTADVGIAPDTATDAAKQAADLILRESDLSVVARGVVEGRRTLGNTMKYVKITASSNFGNVLTVLAASAFLPFLPMLPIQLMAQNLLYDTAQLALPWDRVDDDYLRRPRRWDASGLARFMLVFGPLSSLVDLTTFAALVWVFDAGTHPALFQTGWFVHGLLSQVLIVLVLRTRTLPWRGAHPTRPVLVAAAAVAVLGSLLPISPLADALRMRPLPAGYLLWLVACLLAYGLAAHWVKTRYARRQQSWL
ncbi:Mg2+-importing ATPase [Streptoalloteichus tenebrarius]|uniref:Magnesium-transporting ATPase, P-type 1 n=1 Tax=Streptoalloteichus tenebrarius (strain ATCC 17920 / DSM 40477 / JCM 4838 / CBS 697.72 / NBRC 16177 / NCIMB 11028 / NRRL B-12390 / A12253. 1 / ISP 5477) TaxID=1933 RepID=A0ABT1HPE7_STRSD|nr:magnesium-translocating P-type ATPase [Streptoalloteichus tenebrarius]MCP2257386.1 Mg2+-importing ATPase [Streptoalloteichus tenebrarius]BFE98332.1 magnesium-translocating P-type ATPase [Streptoalloteichus tenebrarius]